MSDKKRLALICEDPANLFDMARNEDRNLLQALNAAGWDAVTKDWKDSETDWTDFDLVILKSPYDYHNRLDEFRVWLNKLSVTGVRLLNPVQTVLWNADKHYLREIAAAGFDIIPSVFLEKDTVTDLATLFDRLGADKIIVKPCISGGSKNTFTLTKGENSLDEHPLNTLLPKEAFIAQPFMKEIHEGEWSMLFFGGEYSHTIVKKPKQGDFRVQPQYGATILAVTPETAVIEKATALVRRFATGALYTRVDGVLADGKLLLMELELIEPLLYTVFDENSFDRYIAALDKVYK
jgi:glutathione synthase/RimK-type ligase-like ATP-grasp enzyme